MHQLNVKGTPLRGSPLTHTDTHTRVKSERSLSFSLSPSSSLLLLSLRKKGTITEHEPSRPLPSCLPPSFFLLLIKFSALLELARVGDDDLLAGRTTGGANGLHLAHNVHALRHLPEDRVSPVQPGERGEKKEKDELIL